MLKNTRRLTRSLSGTFVALALAGGAGAVVAKDDAYTLQGSAN